MARRPPKSSIDCSRPSRSRSTPMTRRALPPGSTTVTTASSLHPGCRVHLDQCRGRRSSARVAAQHAFRSAFVTPTRHLDTCPIQKQLEHQRVRSRSSSVIRLSRGSTTRPAGPSRMLAGRGEPDRRHPQAGRGWRPDRGDPTRAQHQQGDVLPVTVEVRRRLCRRAEATEGARGREREAEPDVRRVGARERGYQGRLEPKAVTPSAKPEVRPC
jgi:hypothetical protein